MEATVPTFVTVDSLEESDRSLDAIERDEWRPLQQVAHAGEILNLALLMGIAERFQWHLLARSPSGHILIGYYRFSRLID